MSHPTLSPLKNHKIINFRPLQRKLVILVTSQLLNDEGRAKGVRAAR